MNRKAFTLIELLVVVAVLALLASIVTSNLGGAREGARISNALSFQSNMHSLLGSDLVGWWNFNEGDARDISGYNNHGNIVGATHVDGVPGTGGSALEFNGSSDYVDVGKTILPAQGNWTFSVWVNVPQNPSGSEHGSIFLQGASASGLFYAYTTYGTADGHLRWNGVGSTQILVGSDIRGTGWRNIALQRENNNYRLYLDGEVDAFGSNSGDINTGNMLFGHGGSGGGRELNGKLDDVRIYSRALSASEIQTLYAQTKDNYLAENE